MEAVNCWPPPGGREGRVTGSTSPVAQRHASAHSTISPLELSLTADASRGRRGELSGLCGGKRSEEHTSELQSLRHLVCRLLLEKKKTKPVWCDQQGRGGTCRSDRRSTRLT